MLLRSIQVVSCTSYLLLRTAHNILSCAPTTFDLNTLPEIHGQTAHVSQADHQHFNKLPVHVLSCASMKISLEYKHAQNRKSLGIYIYLILLWSAYCFPEWLHWSAVSEAMMKISMSPNL